VSVQTYFKMPHKHEVKRLIVKVRTFLHCNIIVPLGSIFSLTVFFALKHKLESLDRKLFLTYFFVKIIIIIEWKKYSKTIKLFFEKHILHRHTLFYCVCKTKKKVTLFKNIFYDYLNWKTLLISAVHEK
jgi:hypothetical protein